MSQHLNTVRQIAYVVEDMEKALKYWTEYLKAGPFFTLEHAPMENQKYRGGPSNADVSIALGNSGDGQIGLIVLVPLLVDQFFEAHDSGFRVRGSWIVRPTMSSAVMTKVWVDWRTSQ